jgi:hypothetical protein
MVTVMAGLPVGGASCWLLSPAGLFISNFAWRIAPRRIDYGVNLSRIHGCDNCIAKGDLLLVAVGVEARSRADIWIALGIECMLYAILNAGKV